MINCTFNYAWIIDHEGTKGAEHSNINEKSLPSLPLIE